MHGSHRKCQSYSSLQIRRPFHCDINVKAKGLRHLPPGAFVAVLSMLHLDELLDLSVVVVAKVEFCDAVELIFECRYGHFKLYFASWTARYRFHVPERYEGWLVVAGELDLKGAVL